jgi:hypothetical protein
MAYGWPPMADGWKRRLVEVSYHDDVEDYRVNGAPASQWVEAGVMQANWTIADHSIEWPAEIHVTAGLRGHEPGVGLNEAPAMLVLLKPDGHPARCVPRCAS